MKSGSMIDRNVCLWMFGSLNTVMLHVYWFIGREIIEHEQQGAERAEYGEKAIKKLSKRLAGRFGKGCSASSLRRMRQFYQSFPNGSLLPEDMRGEQKRATLLSESQNSFDDSVLVERVKGGDSPLFLVCQRIGAPDRLDALRTPGQESRQRAGHRQYLSTLSAY